MSQEFVHLHLHTEFSLLDGFTRIDHLFDQLKALNMQSVAITDHGVMFGAVDFYKEAKKHGIKAIIGCEVYVAKGSRFEKDPIRDKSAHHLVLLAKNEVGYRNLIHLVSIGFTEGFYYKPRIDLEILERHAEGLIALSACIAGEIQTLIVEDRYEEAKALALKMDKMFGRDSFYLELQDHGIDIQKKINMGLLKISKETGIPICATNDVHYIHREDHMAHDVLLCIQTAKTVEDPDRMKFPTNEFYLKSPSEMAELFPYAPEAITNTQKIADLCEFDFDFDTIHLPEFIPASGEEKPHIRDLARKGLLKRYGTPNNLGELESRLDFELSVIEEMGYEDYFLIVWDFIKFAKENNIAVGPGRGSCGGSIVAYVLEITDVDPIKYDLIFERFLNPERVTMPDIDIDFEDARRGEVIAYVNQKYGKEKVAQIVTFGTMAARAAIRDVGRALAIPYHEVDQIAKEIPFMLGITIDKALQMNKNLMKQYEESPDAKRLIDTAKKLEGVPRHSSTHAAGVVIAKENVDHYVPLSLQDNNITTQYNMVVLEELGLLKMDFLGLRTLTVIKDALRFAGYTGEMDIEDESVYQLIATGNTLGMFQLESPGMRKFLKELKPNCLEDIIAGISLYRPGPMDSIPKYVDNKNNPDKVTYLHPKLEGILSVTHGCIVYQEQVMRIVRELAGYSYGQSDMVRRAMSKKKMDVMAKERLKFIHGVVDEKTGDILIEGCLRRGVPEQVANIVFDDMTDFAKYAFNKSHAAGYAILAYQTAWLKKHYPAEFFAAVLTSMLGNHRKISQYIEDAKGFGIKLLPPDVNESFATFTVENGHIRYGLLAVKNVGHGIVGSTVAHRRERPYKDFIDYCSKVDHEELNKKALESLIKAGCFDSMGHTRRELLFNMERVVDVVSGDKKRNLAGQLSLFAGVEDTFKIEKVEEFSKEILLNFEKEMTGIYQSGHPLDAFRDVIKSINTVELSEVVDLEYPDQIKFDNHFVELCCMINKVSTKITKNNSQMATFMAEDLNAFVDCIVFPKTFERYRNLIEENKVVLIKGRFSVREDEAIKIMVDDVKNVEKSVKKKKLFLKIPQYDPTLLESIKTHLLAHPGKIPVVIYLANEKSKIELKSEYFTNEDGVLIEKLGKLLGDKNVIVKVID